MTTYIPSLTIPHSVFASPAASILLPISLGTLVGYSTRPKETKKTYESIRQPPLRPPPYVFGPTWTLLYGLMGYAAHRAVTSGLAPLAAAAAHNTPQLVHDTKHSATLYTIQLGLNLAWMPLFFGLRRPVEATVDVVALLGINVWITSLWWNIDRVAAYCMLPYLGWLSFATYLCSGAGYLNGWTFKGKDLKEV